MKTFTKALMFLVFCFFETEGKVDIKCRHNQTQEVDISEFQYGNIYSPGFTEGKPYTNEMKCEVILNAQKGKYIRLSFNHIDIAINPLCVDDSVSVVNYLNETANQIIGDYCGNVQVPDFISTTDRVEIHFKSSHVGTGKGFNITYREVSNPNLCKEEEIQCRNRKCILKENNICNGKDDCGDGTDEEECDFPLETPAVCGVPKVQPIMGNAVIDRVVGGREALRGSWPWQVDMQVARTQINGHFCGGTLLNSQWFVTAAHCIAPVRRPFVSRVHLGNHHKYKADPYEQVRYVKEFFVYGGNTEEFMINGEYNLSQDLALVKMNAPVKMNPHVQIACLPQQNEELKTGELCFSTGWGMTRGSGSENVLKQSQHPIQPAVKCKNDFQKFENETMICAGRLEALHGLCHGDSGGPLVCKKDDKWHVYGATSFITDTTFLNGLCGLPKIPTVFSKISSKIDWIKSTISQNS